MSHALPALHRSPTLFNLQLVSHASDLKKRRNSSLRCLTTCLDVPFERLEPGKLSSPHSSASSSSSSSSSSSDSQSPKLTVALLDISTPLAPLTPPPSTTARRQQEKIRIAKVADKEYRKRLRAILATRDRESSDEREFFGDSIRVVGRPITDADRNFLERIQHAVKEAESNDPSIPEMVKAALEISPLHGHGTYFIKEIDPEKRSLLATLKAEDISQFIAQHIHTIAVMQPADEVRGAEHSWDINAAKHGITPKWEVPNKVIAAGLTEDSVSIEAPVTSRSFTLLNTSRTSRIDSEQRTKQCFLTPFIPNAKTLLAFKLASKSCHDHVIDRCPKKYFDDMAAFDLYMGDVDRNLENMLINEKTGKIEAIDHALLLASKFQSPAVFAWFPWKQAHEPFNAETREKISALNFEEITTKIRRTYPTYPTQNLETLKICLYLLQQATRAGLTPFEIGCFFTGNLSCRYSSPMGFLYRRVRGPEERDPDAVYRRVTKAIDTAIVALKTHSETLRRNAHEKVCAMIEDDQLDEDDKYGEYVKRMQTSVEEFLFDRFHV